MENSSTGGDGFRRWRGEHEFGHRSRSVYSLLKPHLETLSLFTCTTNSSGIDIGLEHTRSVASQPMEMLTCCVTAPGECMCPASIGAQKSRMCLSTALKGSLHGITSTRLVVMRRC